MSVLIVVCCVGTARAGYIVTYDCGSASGATWYGDTDNPTPSNPNCNSGSTLAGYCCMTDSGQMYHISWNSMIPDQIPNLDSNVTCSALWSRYILTQAVQYNIGNCSTAASTNLLGNSPSYSVGVGWIETEECYGPQQTLSTTSLPRLSPYNSSLNWTPASASNIFTISSAGDLSNCVTFDGWSADGGNNVTYSCTDGSNGTCGTVNVSGGFENLYAHCTWTQYPVIYHGCDGTSTSPSTVTYGGSFNVLSYADTNLNSGGYAFQNWNTAADGSGTDYAPNATFTMNDCAVSGTTIDLYAQCNCDTGYVDDGNGNCVSDTPTTYTVTYSCGSPGSGIDDGGSGTAPTDNTAYSGGDSVTVPTAQDVMAPGVCVGTPTGCVSGCPSSSAFKRWACSNNSGSFYVSSGGTFNITSDTLCTAKWYTVQITILLNAPDVSGWIASTDTNGHFLRSYLGFNVYPGNNFSSPMSTNQNPLTNNDIPSRAGYTFQGYYSQSQGNATQPVGTQYIDANGYITVDGIDDGVWGYYNDSVQLRNWYAGWTPKKYNILYYPNGHGSFSNIFDNYASFGPGVNNGGATYGQNWSTKSFADTGISPVAGYVFCGWSENPNDTCGSNTILAENTTQGICTYDGNDGSTFLNLYAIWECDTNAGYTLVNNACVKETDTTVNLRWLLDNGQGSLENYTTSCTYGSGTINLGQSPTRTGYSFNGWKVTDWECPVPQINSNASASSRGYKDNSGVLGSDLNTEKPYYESFLTEKNTWAVRFTNFTLVGMARCSSTNNTSNDNVVPSDAQGSYCWCKITGYREEGVQVCDMKYFKWVQVNGFPSDNLCLNGCSNKCSQDARYNSNMRNAMLTQTQ